MRTHYLPSYLLINKEECLSAGVSVCVNAMNDLVLDPLAGAVKIPWDTGVLCTYIYSIIHVAFPQWASCGGHPVFAQFQLLFFLFNESLFT